MSSLNPSCSEAGRPCASAWFVVVLFQRSDNNNKTQRRAARGAATRLDAGLVTGTAHAVRRTQDRQSLVPEGLRDASCPVPLRIVRRRMLPLGLVLTLHEAVTGSRLEDSLGVNRLLWCDAGPSPNTATD
jgi:hypothetical protein